jgi:hypothetical protein
LLLLRTESEKISDGYPGGDVWTLARIGGHSSIVTFIQFAHPGIGTDVDVILN